MVTAITDEGLKRIWGGSDTDSTLERLDVDPEQKKAATTITRLLDSVNFEQRNSDGASSNSTAPLMTTGNSGGHHMIFVNWPGHQGRPLGHVVILGPDPANLEPNRGKSMGAISLADLDQAHYDKLSALFPNAQHLFPEYEELQRTSAAAMLKA
jgi:hypothetical protein